MGRIDPFSGFNSFHDFSKSISYSRKACKNRKNMDKRNNHCDDNDIVGGNQCLCR